MDSGQWITSNFCCPLSIVHYPLTIIPETGLVVTNMVRANSADLDCAGEMLARGRRGIGSHFD